MSGDARTLDASGPALWGDARPEAAAIVENSETEPRWTREQQARDNASWLRDALADKETADAYFLASIAHPQLASLDRLALVSHVEGVTAHFAEDGLSRADYLDAVAANPLLVRQKGETVIGNIEAVIAAFANDGLTRRQYLEAAVDHPKLFGMAAETVIGHVEEVMRAMTAEGMTRSEAIQKAVDRPRLFTRGVEAMRPGHREAANPLDTAFARGVPTTLVSDPSIEALSREFAVSGTAR